MRRNNATLKHVLKDIQIVSFAGNVGSKHAQINISEAMKHSLPTNVQHSLCIWDNAGNPQYIDRGIEVFKPLVHVLPDESDVYLKFDVPHNFDLSHFKNQLSISGFPANDGAGWNDADFAIVDRYTLSINGNWTVEAMKPLDGTKVSIVRDHVNGFALATTTYWGIINLGGYRLDTTSFAKLSILPLVVNTGVGFFDFPADTDFVTRIVKAADRDELQVSKFATHRDDHSIVAINREDTLGVVTLGDYAMRADLENINTASIKTIAGITLTDGLPVSVNSVGHGLVTGVTVQFDSMVGTTELEGKKYVVTVTDVDNFTLDGTEYSAATENYSAFTSGNAVKCYPSWKAVGEVGRDDEWTNDANMKVCIVDFPNGDEWGWTENDFRLANGGYLGDWNEYLAGVQDFVPTGKERLFRHGVLCAGVANGTYMVLAMI